MRNQVAPMSSINLALFLCGTRGHNTQSYRGQGRSNRQRQKLQVTGHIRHLVSKPTRHAAAIENGGSGTVTSRSYTSLIPFNR
uniref:Putative secreted protein n=1 Tax=Anopheles triannulatus TaxID=58253 RepID=A0A2M4B7L5_9DIPT